MDKRNSGKDIYIWRRYISRVKQHANCRLCTYALEVMLRQHAYCRLCTYATEVVLRQHANCRLCTYAPEVVLRQHANCRLCTYALEVVLTLIRAAGGLYDFRNFEEG